MVVETVHVDAKGRLVIPVAMRRALGIEGETDLVARVEGDAVILMPRDALWEKITGLVSGIRGSLTDALLADRRAEVEAEGGATSRQR